MDLLSKIQLQKNSLTKNERKACDAIMEDMLLVQHHSLAELSEEIGVTKTSILRFCNKLGYSGYSEFKYDLINYVNSQDESVQSDNPITEIENLYANAISLIHHSVTEDVIKSLTKEIHQARKVVIGGVVNSYVSAIQLRYALLMYGIDATAVSSTEEMRCMDMSTKEDDLIVVYSVSSKTDIIETALSLKEMNQCKIVLITMNQNSNYKDKVDYFVTLPQVGASNKSLLQDIPIFSVFNEILIGFLNLKRI